LRKRRALEQAALQAEANNGTTGVAHPRPRSRKATTSESFNKLKEKVLEAIHDESVKAMSET
jgi:hypothetical protein